MDSENSLPTTAPPRKLLTVVTPCYNEEANVREMSEAIRELFAGPLSKYDYEHIFIDNASRDRTASILRELAARDPRIKVIINTRTFGHVRSPYHAFLSMSLSTGGLLSGTPSGSGSYPFSVSVTDSSTPPLSVTESFTLTIAPPPATLLTISAPPLNFSYVQGDSNLPPAENIGVLSNPSGTGITANSSGGGTWLNVVTSFSSGGKTPGTITVSVNPSNLAPSTYSAQVTLTAANASPSNVTLNVTLTVSPSQAPQVAVTPPVQSFALPVGGQSQGSIVVSNAGGGTLSYSVRADSDANWLALSGSSVGIVSPSTPASVAFTVNATTPSLGLHAGTITVTDLGSGISQVSNVALLVNGSQPTMQLSQSGVTFFAVRNAGVSVPAQTISVFNLGSGTFSWTTQQPQPQYLPANQNSWLTVTPSGTSSAGTAGQATFSVNPTGLPDGQYYATVNVTSAGAANSPQTLSVQLNVVDVGTLGSAPEVSTWGTILAASAGSTAGVSQALTLFSPAGANLDYSTAVSTTDGGNWLTVTPPTGSLGGGGTSSLTIQASAAAVNAGVHYGTVQVAFSEGTVQTIQVALVALGTVSSSGEQQLRTGPRPLAAGCTATKLVATFSSPGANAQLQVAQQQTLQVQIKDDCNQPLLATQATAPVVYVNGANPQPLSATDANGTWAGSWTPAEAQSSVQLRVFASRGQTFGGISTPPPPQSVVNVAVLPANSDAAAQPVGAINGASFDTSNPGLVVPGAYVSVYGDRMADSTVLGGAPLQLALGGTQLLLGGKPLPLLFVTPGQVNGLIPQSLPVGTQVELQVQRDSTASVPVSAYVTDLQPGIFTTTANGQGQGSIVIVGTSQVAGPVGPGQQPVSRGEYISIYGTGLGAVVASDGVSPPPADGQPAPASGSPYYTTVAKATVTIGGVSIPPTPYDFSGLSPGYVALYQVNVQVPANAQTGNAVPLVLTMTDANGHSVSSQTVTIAVQ